MVAEFVKVTIIFCLLFQLSGKQLLWLSFSLLSFGSLLLLNGGVGVGFLWIFVFWLDLGLGTASCVLRRTVEKSSVVSIDSCILVGLISLHVLLHFVDDTFDDSGDCLAHFFVIFFILLFFKRFHFGCVFDGICFCFPEVLLFVCGFYSLVRFCLFIINFLKFFLFLCEVLFFGFLLFGGFLFCLYFSFEFL